MGSEGTPPLSSIAEAFLRLHPIDSAFKTALLSGAPIDGIGFTAQTTDQGIEAAVVLKFDAPLTTSNSPLSLAHLAPTDSFFVLDSFDLTAAPSLALVIGVFAPVRGEVSASVTASLPGAVLTPPPTPTPTPTPEPLTAADLIAQVQPIITQAESLAGLSLADLYSLIDGEYAVALFPNGDSGIGEALYLRSSDPQRIIDALDRVSKLILINPDGERLVNIERSTTNGVEVALITPPGMSDRLALALLGDGVLVATTESLLPHVLQAAQSDNAAAWLPAFSGAQQGAFSLDVRTLDFYALQIHRDPPLPLTTISGTLDVRDDGALVLHLSGVRGG